MCRRWFHCFGAVQILNRLLLVQSQAGIFLNNYSAYADKISPKVIPAGMCAFMYYNKKTDESAPFWKQIMKAIDDNGYKHLGEAFRTIAIEDGLGIDDVDYLAQIRIPVSKKR